jgi:CBS-domain-containing membrane protein
MSTLSSLQTFADGMFYNGEAINFPVRDRQIIEVDADAEISVAFTVLVTHQLLCAPVWDAQQQGYLGFFDVEDALNIVSDIDLVANAGGETETSARLRTTAVKVVDVFNPVNRMRNPQMQAPWIAVGPKTPMKEVITILATIARRVPIVDPGSGKVLKIISQMDVVKQLYSSLGATKTPPSLFDSTPHVSGIGIHPVVCVTEDDEARTAFKTMIDKNVSAVGITDEEGSLCGMISNKDILVVLRSKGWGGPQQSSLPNKTSRGRFSIASSTMGNVNVFAMPTMMFVQEARSQSEKNKAKTHVAVAEVGMDTTFKHIIGMLATTGFHRIFIVDEQKKPLGVVSVADICTLVNEGMMPEPAPVAKAPPVPKRSMVTTTATTTTATDGSGVNS